MSNIIELKSLTWDEEESLEQDIIDMGLEIFPEFPEIFHSWEQNDISYTGPSLKLLLKKFGSFVDNCQYVSRNYIILGSARFKLSVGKVRGEVIYIGETSSGIIEADEHGNLYASPDDLYVYLGCTAEDADEYLKSKH